MINIYPVFFDNDTFSGLDISCFSSYRREKIESCRNPKAKNCRIAATVALENALSELGLREADMEYSENEYGKPGFKTHPEIHFSLSHTDGFAVAAISDSPIGIDCERADRKISRAVLERFFSAGAVTAFDKSPLRLWMAKESYTKLRGVPFAEGAKDIEIPFFDRSCDVEGLHFELYSFDAFDTIVCCEKFINSSL